MALRSMRNLLVFEHGELSLFVTGVGELACEDCLDVLARDVTVVAQLGHASDLRA